MKKRDIQLKNEVMSRVTTIYYMRTVVRPLLIKFSFFLVSLGSLFVLISVPNVIKNALSSHSLTESVSYLLKSFLSTQLIVQLMLLSGAVLFILVVRDFIKNFKHISEFSRASFQ